MIISPKKVYDKRYITNLLDPDKQIGSDGIDLTVKSIDRVDLNGECIITEDKKLNKHRNREGVGASLIDGKQMYVLTEGTYDITFNEGCNLPKGVAGLIQLRSSFVRNGCTGTAGFYDAGFVASNAGFFLHVRGGGKVKIEPNVRIAQIVLFKSNSYKLYSGQYNNFVEHWFKGWSNAT
jgi:deoxycytidine triphosphate deaminase